MSANSSMPSLGQSMAKLRRSLITTTDSDNNNAPAYSVSPTTHSNKKQESDSYQHYQSGNLQNKIKLSKPKPNQLQNVNQRIRS